jgi:hypothetical protein
MGGLNWGLLLAWALLNAVLGVVSLLRFSVIVVAASLLVAIPTGNTGFL